MGPFLIVLCIILVIGLVFFLPIKGARSFVQHRPVLRVHESDAVLSRRLLIPGTRAYTSYYKQHPEFLESDEKSRKAPGLLGNKSRYFHTETFAASKANFDLIDFLGQLTHGTTNTKDAVKVNPDKSADFIRQWLKNTGAHSVGFTRLEDYHLYSHKGRGPGSGEAIQKEHANAIALTVEMDHRMMQSAPEGSSVMESSEQYLQSGVLALKLAAWIRELGYDASAHIDGNYEVICPLVAVDAGLGTIGRMGLLMTPRLGPRVRIAVVTTNLPVSFSKGSPDRTTLHFCHLCKKCAKVCPAAAIPEVAPEMIDGIERWQISSEKCYHFWTTSGTDCGRCMSVCPYSHPDNSFHRFIRWGIKNNLLFRHLAVKLDDLFYGPKPTIRPLPDWTDIRE